MAISATLSALQTADFGIGDQRLPLRPNGVLLVVEKVVCIFLEKYYSSSENYISKKSRRWLLIAVDMCRSDLSPETWDLL